MKRKIIQLAGSTLVVSLPHKWAKEVGLTKGQEVDIATKGNELTLSCVGGSPDPRTQEINLQDFGVLARRTIGALYKSGYDEVKIRFDNPLLLRTIHEVVQGSLIGFEVVSEGKQHCVLKKISHINSKEYATMFRRMFWLLINVAEETAQNFSDFDKEVAQQLIARDATLNKFADYARRCLNKGAVAEMRNSNLQYYLVEQLERIGDDYKKLNRLLVQSPVQRKEIGAFFVQLHTFLELFSKLFYDFNHKDLRTFGEMQHSLQKESEALFLLCSKHEARVASVAQNIFQMIYDMNGALLTYHV